MPSEPEPMADVLAKLEGLETSLWAGADEAAHEIIGNWAAWDESALKKSNAEPDLEMKTAIWFCEIEDRIEETITRCVGFAALLAHIRGLQEENERLKALIVGLAERVAKQSELLAGRAEK